LVDTALTGRQLLTRIHRAAQHLSTEGVGEGARVAVDAENPLDSLSWFLGADVLGAACLIIESAWSDRERQAIMADTCPTAVVHGTPAVAAKSVPPVGDGSTRFYLATTSGSSGRSRVLVRRRDSWRHSFRAFHIGLEPAETVLIPGPLSSSLFLFGALHALHDGHSLRLMRRWSADEAASECLAATVIHVVPAMLSALLSLWERQPHLRQGCGLRKIVCAGAKLSESLRERLDRVLPGCELVEYYGSAEQSLVAIRRGEQLRPVAGVELEVRDDSGTPLPAGNSGRLWVRSPLLFDGYLDGGTLDFPADWRDGWSSVGDYATQHAEGTLTIHGRSGSTISTAAKNIAAEEVEAVLHRAAGVLDVIVSATPHPRLGAIVTAVVEADPASPPSLRELRAVARAELEPAKRPRRWLITAQLPRTAAGKPSRAEVSERLREGTLR